jgi:hypothetical protein
MWQCVTLQLATLINIRNGNHHAPTSTTATPQSSTNNNTSGKHKEDLEF